MKQLITLGIIATLILVGCSVDWNNTRDKKIEELSKQILDLKNTTSTGMTLFEKQTKCGTLEPDVEKKITSIQKEYTGLGKLSLGGGIL